jgi:hypothetical protein
MSPKTDRRSRAEEQFSKARKTHEEAKGAVEAETRAMRAKTARLKEQRLAKQASDATEGKELPAAKRKPRAKTA